LATEILYRTSSSRGLGEKSNPSPKLFFVYELFLLIIAVLFVEEGKRRETAAVSMFSGETSNQ
jgi:hypothetical protein